MNKPDLTTLTQFTGTANYYRLNRKCLLTDGTKYLADTASAFWLMDAATSYLLELGTADWFVLVRLSVCLTSTILTARRQLSWPVEAGNEVNPLLA